MEELGLQIVVVFIMGVAFIVGGINTMRNWHASKYWPTTSGKILLSRLRGVDDDRALISYEYQVAGKTYTSSNIALGQSVFAKVQETLAQYPEGAEVKVLYDPNKPSVAYLQRGENHSQGVLAAVIGAVLLFGDVLMIVLFTKS